MLKKKVSSDGYYTDMSFLRMGFIKVIQTKTDLLIPKTGK